MRGLLITFEGGEGAGKTTQARRLATSLQHAGRTVLLTREPGGSPGAEALRRLLLTPDLPLSWRAQVLGHMAARADHLDATIRPALKRGEIVICDRFHDSTLAYQGFGAEDERETGLTFIRKIKGLLACEPGLTFFLDLPVSVGLARAKARLARQDLEVEDRYEEKGRAFHERVTEGFRTLAKAEPERIFTLDGEAPPDIIAGKILSITQSRMIE